MSRRKHKPEVLLASAVLPGRGGLFERGRGRTVHFVGDLPKAGRHANFDAAAVQRIQDGLDPHVRSRRTMLSDGAPETCP
jgi:hypothetical protein